MQIFNRERERAASNISLTEFARAMQGLDLSSIPPEKRRGALIERLMHVMAHSLQDPSLRTAVNHALLARSQSG